MKSPAEKKHTTGPAPASKPFFSKTEKGTILGQTESLEQPFFAPDISRQAGTGGESKAHNPAFFQRRSQLIVQPQLMINDPGDRYEQEADAMAKQVMQKSASADGEDKSIQPQALSLPTLMRKGADPDPNAVPAIVHEVLSAPGHSLDATTRIFMEPRFGHGFSQVRMHADAKAAESAGVMNALAYTVGRDVVFGAGHYQPHTSEGRRLLAHELSHTIQQGAAPRQDNLFQSAGEGLHLARSAQAPVIARKDGATRGPSHKANDPNQLKSDLHPTGKAHLYADQVASIYFGTKSYVPDQDDHRVLKALAQEYLYTAQRQGGLLGKVIGHADVEASSDPDNQELSFQRARWTAAVFKSYVADAANVPAANLQFETEGAGTGFCLGDQDCKGKVRSDAMARYRRADIMIFTEKMPGPQVSSCPPASGAGVKTLGEYIELIRCAEVKTGFTPRMMLAMLRQMYYGKDWSATTKDPNWNFVIPCSPDVGHPRDKLGQNLFDALHNTVTIEGIDLGHVFTGLESMTCPTSSVTMEKSKFGAGIKLTVDLSNESFATWGGDLGSVAGAFVACWMMSNQERATKGKDDCHQGRTPESLMQYFVKRQSPPADLEGDIAPFVMRAAEIGACRSSLEQRFTPQVPISSIFTNFFYNRGPGGMTSRDRYQCFTEVIGATVVNGKITNRAALIQKYKPGVLSFAWAYYVNLKKEIPRSDPIMPLLERNSRAALHLFFDWLQARIQK
jgi:outer membrane protein OmpA-like peptidoglycan-associated protein